MTPAEDGLFVNDALTIPRSELQYRASRSGGPGGQHVNTSSTRIELLWGVGTSTALSEELRTRLLEKLSTRMDSEGVVRVVASDQRSQGQNRESSDARLAELVRKALIVPKPRKKTRPTKASKERRLTEKKRNAERKRMRRPDVD